MLIGTKEIELKLDMQAWAEMEEKIGFIYELDKLLKGNRRIDTTIKLIECLSHGAADREFINANLMPRDFGRAANAIRDAISKAFVMQEADEKKTESAT